MPLWHMLQRLASHVDPVAREADAFPQDAPHEPTPQSASAQPPTNEDLQTLREVVRDCCHRFGYQHQEDDLYQDMVCDILRLNIIGRYDPKRALLKTYLSKFVYRRFINIYERQCRTRGFMQSIEDLAHEHEAPAVQMPDAILLRKLEAVAQQLVLQYPPDTAALFDTETLAFVSVISWNQRAPSHTWPLWRDHGIVFRLLCLGLEQQEIASMLRLSRGNVCHRVEDIRNWPGVQQLRQMLYQSMEE